jgi:hypothetical protein
MSIHILSANGLVQDLAANRVTPQQQAVYLILNFCVWIVPSYLYLFPAPTTTEVQSFFWSAWLIEMFLLVLICITGVNLCLRKCRVDPRKNFLVDFNCLSIPVTITTLIVIWGVFHLFTTLPAWLLVQGTVANDSLWWLPWLQSSRIYDVMRLLASVGVVFITFLRIGEQMERLSRIRESANFSSSGRESA